MNKSMFRITPAGAGKTLKHFAHNVQRQDHPRRCGENLYLPPPLRLDVGSPPQVRGKQEDYDGRRRRRRDHPRRCGENSRTSAAVGAALGSPPQVRGKPHSIYGIALLSGITPAGAGKTPIHTIRIYTRWDHPRRCGENPPPPRASCAIRGSPPQVRGKHRQWTDLLLLCRITPAGAGKTPVIIYAHISRWDHPRRCGENALLSIHLLKRLGSPPQVRGKPLAAAINGCRLRITPAGAGKTLRD